MTNQIVSSLTEEEMDEAYFYKQETEGHRFNYTEARSNLANAAAQQAIEELEAPKEWIAENYPTNGYSLHLIFRHYLRDLKEGKL